MNTSYSYSIGGAGAAVMFLLMIAFYVLVVIGLWKTFIKAGHPGWAAIIPFYNIYIWVQIAGRPTWWFWVILVGALLGWIPIIGWILIIAIWVMSLFLALDVAKNFGQGTGFGILLWLFSGIMYLVLGFGDYQYKQVANVAPGYAQPMAPPPGQPMGQAMDQPMAPAHVPWQSVPPVPGPAPQQMTPPPPLAQPLQPRPLTPPPAQVAPPTPPPAEAAPPTPPPAEAVVEAAEAAPAEVETAEVEAAPAEEAPPESPTPPPPPVS
jgi:hypothetical protein